MKLPFSFSNTIFSLLILLFACSPPRIHIPGKFETKPVFKSQEESSLHPDMIEEAGDLAEQFPEEDIINERIKVTIDFEFNDQYDSALYYKQYLSGLKTDSANKAAQSKKPSRKSALPELTERPIPDGQVFMSSACEYEFRTIRDFVDEPIVLHYNSMISVDKFYAKIDGNPASLKKTDESSDGHMYFKTDSRYRLYELNLPVRGSLVQYEYREECRDVKFNSVHYIADDHFTAKKIVKIALPQFLDFDIIEMNFEGLNVSRDTVWEYPKTGSSREKTKYLVYTFKRVKPFQNYSSDRGPSYNYPLLYFHFKSARKNGRHQPILRNTDDLYNWYRLVSSNLRNDTSVFADFTRQLVKNAKSDEDKIKSVFYWIQDNIRYIAFEDGMAGFRPDECADVFRKRYGDCKGMANLCKHMLKVLGFDARLVWIGTRHQNFSYDVPGLPVDNHAICAVKLNGRYVFLDGTETYVALHNYAARIQGRRCIVENGESYSIETIPNWDYNHNEERTEDKIRISGNTLECEVYKTFRGESKLNFLRDYNGLRTQFKDEALYNYASGGHADFTAGKVSSGNLSLRDTDPELKYRLTVNNQIIRGGNAIYVNLEWSREYDGMAFDSSRRADLDVNHKICIRRKAILELSPDQELISLPAPVHIDNAWYSFHLEMKQEGRTVVYSKTLLHKQDYLPASVLKTFAGDCGKLTAFYNSYIELRETQKQP